MIKRFAALAALCLAASCTGIHAPTPEDVAWEAVGRANLAVSEAGHLCTIYGVEFDDMRTLEKCAEGVAVAQVALAGLVADLDTHGNLACHGYSLVTGLEKLSNALAGVGVEQPESLPKALVGARTLLGVLSAAGGECKLHPREDEDDVPEYRVTGGDQ